MAGADKEFAREIKITDYPVFNQKKQPISFVIKPNQPISIDMKIFYKVMNTSVLNAILKIIQQAKLRLKNNANKTPVACWWLMHDENTGVLLIHNTLEYAIKGVIVAIKCTSGNEHKFEIPKLHPKEAIQLSLKQIDSCNDNEQKIMVESVHMWFRNKSFRFENVNSRFIGPF